MLILTRQRMQVISDTACNHVDGGEMTVTMTSTMFWLSSISNHHQPFTGWIDLNGHSIIFAFYTIPAHRKVIWNPFSQKTRARQAYTINTIAAQYDQAKNDIDQLLLDYSGLGKIMITDFNNILISLHCCCSRYNWRYEFRTYMV